MQKLMRCACVALIATTLGACSAISPKSSGSETSSLHVENLRCEYLVNPLGIDVGAPRLSWVLRSDARTQRQTAYQILVASTAEELEQDRGDLWDTGKVLSDETSQLAYRGSPLGPRQACWWKARTWDGVGHASTWSAPAHWEMGLLKPDDWHAQWINAEARAPLNEAFRLVSASYETTDRKTSQDVTATLAALVKDSILEVKADNRTLGGDPAPNKHKQLRVTYETAVETREEVVLEDSTLHIPPVPLPYLHKTFTLAKPIRSARLYVTALGLYEVRLNGQRVGDHMLAPEWTDYNKRIVYQAYDVTALLKRGDNAIAALVGDGWYSGHIGNGGFQRWGKVPALLAQLEITYADGTSDRVVSDATWKTRASPILRSDFMLGESYDARNEVRNWDQPDGDDSDWQPATVREEPARPLVAQSNEPVRALRELPAKSITEPVPGRWTFDLGQNMVGVVRLKVSAAAGTKLTLRHAEMLNPDGTLYTTNLRGAPSVDTYVCRGGGGGDGTEVWQPRFTFHGFRYVELTGLPTKPSLDAVTGIVLGSDTPRAGEFTCSDPRINQLQSNIEWGQRGNFLSVPTDCPQRDERLGWMGDAEVFCRTATCNADVAAFFTKWLTDVDDAQLADGRFPDVSPNTMRGSAVPGWADAGVICPWTIYQVYGDKRILEQHWPAMVRWVEWCREHSTGLIRDKDRGSDYGDWLAIGAKTPKDLIGTAYFAYSTRLLAKTAAVLGKAEDAAKYQALFEQIKAAFNARFVQPDGRIAGDTQTGYVLALQFELLPESIRAKAAQLLVDDIRAKDWHLSTGFLGVSYLLPALTRSGQLDAAYRLLMQDTFPSWLFSVKNGATTIWERWDGWTPDKGFQDPGMNSFNHYSLGSCGEWLFDTVAGISLDPDRPGFGHILIHPHVPSTELRTAGGLTWVKARYESIRGPITSNWSLAKDGTLTLDIAIPANTTATVFVPAGADARVTEGGHLAEQSAGVHVRQHENGARVLEVGSGSYRFHVAGQR